nr:transmembrane protein 134 [Loxodonta africana]
MFYHCVTAVTVSTPPLFYHCVTAVTVSTPPLFYHCVTAVTTFPRACCSEIRAWGGGVSARGPSFRSGGGPFLRPELGWGRVEAPAQTPVPPSPLRLRLCAVLILIGVGLEVSPSPGVSSAIFFVPGFLLLVPGGPPRLPVLLPALLRKVIGGRASARSARPSEPHLTGRTLKTAPLGVGSGSSIGPGKMPRVCSVP